MASIWDAAGRWPRSWTVSAIDRDQLVVDRRVIRLPMAFQAPLDEITSVAHGYRPLWVDVFMHRGLFPASTCLEPEDRRGYRLPTFADRFAVEAFCDASIGLHLTTGELLGIGPRQVGDVDIQHIGDVGR